MNLPISVIIPCFKSKDTIFRAFDSIQQQKSKPSEIIIIDDNSDDGTLELIYQMIINSPIPVVVMCNSTNKGPAFSRNLGIEKSSYPYVAFLDADDSWHKDKLDYQYKVMKQHAADLCGHKIEIFSHDSISHNKTHSNKTIKVIEIKDLIFHNYFSTPSVIMKKNYLHKFNVHMRRCEDYNLWLKIVYSGKKAVYIDEIYGNVHKEFYGSRGLSKSLFLMEISELRCIFEYFFKINLFFILTALIFSMVKFIRRIIYVYFRKLYFN